MVKERLFSIDVIKGILLCFICVSHMGPLPHWVVILTKPTAYLWVPMFFVISGYLMDDKKESSTFLKRKLQTLLIPYIVFSVIFILLDWNSYLQPSSILGNLHRAFFIGIGPYKASPLWFVLCLFESAVFAYTFIRYIRRRYIFCTVVLLSLLAWWLSFTSTELPLLWHLLPSATAFILSGYLIKTTPPMQAFILLLMLMAVAILVAINSNPGDMHFNQITCYPLFYMLPTMCIYSLIGLSKRSERHFSLRGYNALRYIAINGIVILTSHCWVVFLVNPILSYCHFTTAITFYIKFSVTAIVLYLIIVPFSNKFLYVWMGKEKKSWRDSLNI